MTYRSTVLAILFGCGLSISAVAADKPAPTKTAPVKFDPTKLVRAKYQVVGLFDPDSVTDLKEAFKDEKLEEVKLIDVDYKTAEMTVEFTPKTAFPGVNKPEQFLEQVNNRVRQASGYVIGVKLPSTIPADKLKRVEIEVASIHCRACSLGLYNHISTLEGVERVTASARDGRVTALIDPTKTDRTALETRLKQRGVRLKDAAKPEKK